MADTRYLPRRGVEESVRLSAPGLEDGDVLPERHAADGGNVSPALSWSDLPLRTSSVAVTCRDLRGLGGRPFALWILFNLDPYLTGLPEGLGRDPFPPELPGAVHGTNDTGRLGYDGPLPPPGRPPHRYEFRVHALDAPLDLLPGVRIATLQAAMKDRVLATGRLVCIYAR